MNNQEQILRDTLNRFNVLDDAEFYKFINICEFRQYPKKGYLLKAGQYNKGICFVLSGTVGLYRLNDGKKIYENFFLKTDFANELDSLVSQAPTTKNLFAITNVECFFIKRDALIGLYEDSIAFERLGRKILEHILNERTKISSMLISLKPEEKYRYIEKYRPGFIREVPLINLASYLGLARETLSRIRGK
ncbi:MAG: Crp/Fnr family transcriptional regulator [Bacteroidota bacterium]